MNKWLAVFLALNFSVCCFGQVRSPAARTTNDQQKENARMSKSADGAFQDLRNIDVPQTFQKSPIVIMAQDIQPIYRKPGKKDLKDLIPDQSLSTQFDQFLKQPNTGIFKLSADPSCATNLGVVRASEKCASNTIPGAGTAYSFRTNAHRVLHLADLTLDKDIIKTDGVMQQGILVNLGNIDLEQVTPETKGLKYLLEFKPATTKKEIQKLDQQLADGIKVDEFVYRFGFYVDENTTYALRSIAYRGKLMRSIKGVSFNEMDYDKRKDILIAFRIVGKDSNGDLTIIWKEIMKKDSPSLNDN